MLKNLKDVRSFQWTKECQKAFEDLNAYLADPSLLTRPVPEKELLLYLATSPVAVSSNLIREEDGVQRLVYYVSHVLLDAEIRYPQIEKLAFTLVKAARKLRLYFQAYLIVVMTDQPLKKVLHKPDVSERLTTWAIELSEYQIEYRPRTDMKGQALADFVAECTQSENELEEEIVPKEKISPEPSWTMFVDGSSNAKVRGAGFILTSPEGFKILFALCLHFPASNNEVEYEALIGGLQITKAVQVRNLAVRADSQLVVNQVNRDYEAKDDRMAAYLKEVKQLLSLFESFEIIRVPCCKNEKADALSRLSKEELAQLDNSVYVEQLYGPAHLAREVTQVEVEPSWMDPIVAYQKDDVLPQDKMEAQKVRGRAARYTLIEGELYKRSITGLLLKCLTPTHAPNALTEVHQGICDSHMGGRHLAYKVLRVGLYWPNMQKDAI
ncbi:uncharacterized protein LOC122650622 [Telopea speciosissima]|uniref:uncharacterized protein LOC122650622 n=1 Tax=Telopea speciosissima TaxID=54955 RepID=UPI001CC70BC4|nr:uncharacterized protein LOC122650622 [Telopea speciosissima]